MGVRAATDYHQMWRALLPTGPAWALTAAHPLEQLLLAWSALPAELDAATSTMLGLVTGGDLERWEYLLGLPIPQADEQASESRQDTIMARLRLEGELGADSLVAMGAYWGYELVPSMRLPATCNDSCEGVLGAEETGLDCTGACTAPVVDWGWRFCVEVTIASPVPITYASCESPCTASLAAWANLWLEANVRHSLAAHVWARFLYPAAVPATPLNLLEEDVWESIDGLGEAQIYNGELALRIPGEVQANFDGVGGYDGPHVRRSVGSGTQFRIRLNIHDTLIWDRTNACGVYFDTPEGRVAIRVYGSGELELVWLDTNTVVADAMGPLDLVGQGWLWLSHLDGHVYAGFGTEGEPVPLGNVSSVGPTHLGVWAMKTALSIDEQYTSVIPVERV